MAEVGVEVEAEAEAEDCEIVAPAAAIRYWKRRRANHRASAPLSGQTSGAFLLACPSRRPSGERRIFANIRPLALPAWPSVAARLAGFCRRRRRRSWRWRLQAASGSERFARLSSCGKTWTWNALTENPRIKITCWRNFVHSGLSQTRARLPPPCGHASLRWPKGLCDGLLYPKIERLF